MADQYIFRSIVGVVPSPTSTGRARWIATDDQGTDWTIWDSSLALQAQQQQQSQQLAQLKVRIAPAKDPQFGINYTLKAIGPAPPGAVPQPLPPPEQAQQQMPVQQMPMPGMQPMAVQQPGYDMGQPQQSMPQQLPESLKPPTKTMGQGGQFSDSDLTRIARSTGITAAIGAAFTSDDFRDDEGDVDWERVYAVAEAVSKFVLFRKHEGWIPGVEVNPQANERAVLAEVNAVFPGTVVQGVPGSDAQGRPDQSEPDEPDEDDDVPWGE